MDDRPTTDHGDHGDDPDAANDAIDRVLEAEFEITPEQEAKLEQDVARFLKTGQGYAWEDVRAWLLSVGTDEELPFPPLRTLR
jgi:hypothetical protein